MPNPNKIKAGPDEFAPHGYDYKGDIKPAPVVVRAGILFDPSDPNPRKRSSPIPFGVPLADLKE